MALAGAGAKERNAESGTIAWARKRENAHEFPPQTDPAIARRNAWTGDQKKTNEGLKAHLHAMTMANKRSDMRSFVKQGARLRFEDRTLVAEEEEGEHQKGRKRGRKGCNMYSSRIGAKNLNGESMKRDKRLTFRGRARKKRQGR